MPKFRVWNKKTESFIDYGDLILNLKNGKVYAGDVGMPEYTIDVTKQVILMQYTGLKDKNGIEIFEGDILSYAMEEYEPSTDTYVENRRHAEVKHYRGCFFADYLLNVTLSDGRGVQVIGNVYENPELLEVSE